MYPYFQYIDIPNLSDIQQQVYQNYDAILAEREQEGVNTATHKVNAFSVFIVGTNSVFKYSPALVDFLDSVNLKEHLKVIAFVTVNGHAKGAPHADVFYSNCINLPIHNCEGGLTYFYADQDGEAMEAGGKLKAGYKLIREPGKVLATADVSKPQWFNTFKIHQAINEGEGTRYSMSLRFGRYWDTTLHTRTKLL